MRSLNEIWASIVRAMYETEYDSLEKTVKRVCEKMIWFRYVEGTEEHVLEVRWA